MKRKGRAKTKQKVGGQSLIFENYRQQKQDEAIKTNTKNNANNTKKTTQTIQNNKNYQKIIGKWEYKENEKTLFDAKNR